MSDVGASGMFPDVFSPAWPAAMYDVIDRFERDEVKDGEAILRDDLIHVATILDDPEMLAAGQKGSREDVIIHFRRFVGFIEFQIFNM